MAEKGGLEASDITGVIAEKNAIDLVNPTTKTHGQEVGNALRALDKAGDALRDKIRHEQRRLAGAATEADKSAIQGFVDGLKAARAQVAEHAEAVRSVVKEAGKEASP